MEKTKGIILLSLFVLMGGVGIFVIGASAHHGSSGCGLNALFGDCVPTNDVLAVVRHHSAPYQSLGESISRLVVSAFGLLMALGLLVLDKKKDGAQYHQAGERKLRFLSHTFNWRSRFLDWLVFKRTSGLLS